MNSRILWVGGIIALVIAGLCLLPTPLSIAFQHNLNAQDVTNEILFPSGVFALPGNQLYDSSNCALMRHALALCAHQSGDKLNGCMTIAGDLSASCSHDIMVKYWAGEVFLRAGKRERAISVWQTIPSVSVGMRAAARERVAEQRFEDTEALYRLAWAIDPSQTATGYELAMLLKRLGRVGEALLVFEDIGQQIEARRYDPMVAPDMFNDWVHLLFQERSFESGLAACEMAAEAGIQDARLFVLKGHILREQEQYNLAYQAYLQASILDPGSATPPIYMGAVEWQLGRQTAALDHLLHAVHLDPNSDHAHYLFGFMLNKVGQYSEAERELLKSLELNSTRVDARSVLAELYASRGHNVEAVQQCQSMPVQERDSIAKCEARVAELSSKLSNAEE